MGESAFREDNVFVAYDDVLKCISTEVMKLIREEPYASDYKDFIDMESILGKSDAQLNNISQKRCFYNILEYLKIGEFDHTATLAELLIRHPDIYRKSKPLVMCNALNILGNEATTKHIYLYTPCQDKVITEDLGRILSPTTIKKSTIVHGTITEALSAVKDKLTLFVLSDISHIHEIVMCGREEYADIVLANYGYNYRLDENMHVIINLDDKICSGRQFRLAMFKPFSSGDAHR